MNQSLLIALALVTLSVVLVHATSESDFAQANEIQKRKSAFMRFGRSLAFQNYDNDADEMNMEKRKSSYMRFGKRSAEPIIEMIPVEMEPSFYMEKRKPASIRFG